MSEKSGTQAEVNLGMIGHVDAGKTSLTKALTGKWTDTHSEELKRGISIRLGYADVAFRKCEHCKGAEAYTTAEKCGACGKQAKILRTVSFVDAPGHEALMTTMLGGAALMHGAILVVSAHEHCPQAQTVEHLMALEIVGVKNIVVAQNKIDLVSKQQAIENHKEIVEFLKQYGYEKAPIVPTAAHFGTNIDLLIEAIEKTILTPKYETKKPLKMYVARSFDINKPGIKPEELRGGVLGGSIMTGEVSKSNEIEISPGIDGKPILTKVVEISMDRGKLEKAGPGGLIALLTELDPSLTRNDQMRGQIIGKPGTLPKTSKILQLETHILERITEKGQAEIKLNDLLVLTVGTNTTVGNVTKKLKGGQWEFVLKTPVVAEAGEKIALSKRQGARWRLVGYGIVKGAS